MGSLLITILNHDRDIRTFPSRIATHPACSQQQAVQNSDSVKSGTSVAVVLVSCHCKSKVDIEQV